MTAVSQLNAFVRDIGMGNAMEGICAAALLSHSHRCAARCNCLELLLRVIDTLNAIHGAQVPSALQVLKRGLCRKKL